MTNNDKMSSMVKTMVNIWLWQEPGRVFQDQDPNSNNILNVAEQLFDHLQEVSRWVRRLRQNDWYVNVGKHSLYCYKNIAPRRARRELQRLGIPPDQLYIERVGEGEEDEVMQVRRIDPDEQDPALGIDP